MRSTIGLLLFSLLVLPAVARGNDLLTVPPSDELSEPLLRGRLTALEEAPELSPAEQRAARAGYTNALAQWAQLRRWRERIRVHERDAEAAPAAVEALHAKLRRPYQPPEVRAPANASSAALKQERASARGELSSALNTLRRLEREPAARRRRLANFAQRVATVQAILERLEEQLQRPLDKPTPASVATRVALQVERLATLAKLQALKSQRLSDLARRELIPARIEQARREVRAAEDRVAAWERLLAAHELQSAVEAAARARAEHLSAVQRFPSLRPLAQAIEELVRKRLGGEKDPGVVAQIALRTEQLRTVRRRKREIEQEFASLRTKTSLASSSETIGIQLRKEYEQLPKVNELERLLTRLRRELGQVRYAGLLLREEQARTDTAAELQTLRASADASDAAALTERAQRLQAERERQQRDLIEDYERYFELLVELERLLSETLKQISEYRGFIEERIMWVRSSTWRRLIPRWRDVQAVSSWLLSLDSWGRATRTSLNWTKRNALTALAAALALVLILLLRLLPRARWVLPEVVERDPHEDRFTLTLRALFALTLRAAALPALCCAAAFLLAAPLDQPPAVEAVAAGLYRAAGTLFLLLVLYELTAPDSVGRIHLRWPAEACETIRWHLRWVIAVRVPGAFLVTTLHVQRTSDLWNDSLGRLLFVATLAPLVIALHAIFRPSGALLAIAQQRAPQGWLWRGRRLLYAVAVALPLLFCLVSLDGYHFAAVRLQRDFGTWIWLCVLIAIGLSVAARYLRLAHRRAEILARAAAAAPPVPLADPEDEGIAPLSPEHRPQEEGLLAPAGPAEGALGLALAADAEPPLLATTTAPTPAAPAPDTPTPETPTPETPTPETPAPEAPAPEAPAPETPAPETPTPETPAPETPTPETPTPETPAPETPTPETPTPETPAPGTPEATTSAPAADAPTAEAPPTPDILALDATNGLLPWIPPTPEAHALLRIATALALLVGTYVIWSETLPALRVLERLQLWPRLSWTELEPDTPDAVSEETATAAPAAEPSPDPSAAPATAPGAAPVVPPVAPSAGPKQTTGSLSGLLPQPTAKPDPPRRVTLADLLLALAILGFTLTAAAFVPGVLELALLVPLQWAESSRYAVASLVRYAIVLLGIPIAFAMVGIGWKDVQFLAAALTFGLAFGLQEIFANFISGLIILIERPIRIGDKVTVAGENGVVTRIQIRATTIRNFDRRELIVPNKVIVTEKVLNWVLSDPVQRLRIMIRLPLDDLDLLRIRERVLEVAKANPLVLASPAPSTGYSVFGDGFVELQVRVYFDKLKLRLKTELIEALYAELAAQGIRPARTAWRVEIDPPGAADPPPQTPPALDPPTPD